MFFGGARTFGVSARGRVRRVLLVIALAFAVVPAGLALASTTVGQVGRGKASPVTATATRSASSWGCRRRCGSSTRAKALSLGVTHSCALTDSGGVKCWGDNLSGELGNGTRTSSSVPVDVTGLGSGVQAISAGDLYTCSVTDSGAARCWGDNTYGQLGNDTTRDSLAPMDVKGLGGGVKAISAGADHTCALTDAGGVKCWGDNTYGQLGNGTTKDSLAPVDVKGLGSGVAAISAGYNHTCALTDAGEAKCWGLNDFGDLGNGTNTSSSVPVDVKGGAWGKDMAAISADGQNHTCALTGSGRAKCWGYNDHGQLGDGTTTKSYVPVDVADLGSGVQGISAGTNYTCALTDSGGAKCWGYNDHGQLGDSTTTNSSVPIDVTGLGSGVTAVSAGGSHTCALTDPGRVKCWGYNEYGQLGNGTTRGSSVPVDVVGLG